MEDGEKKITLVRYGIVQNCTCPTAGFVPQEHPYSLVLSFVFVCWHFELRALTTYQGKMTTWSCLRIVQISHNKTKSLLFFLSWMELLTSASITWTRKPLLQVPSLKQCCTQPTGCQHSQNSMQDLSQSRNKCEGEKKTLQCCNTGKSQRTAHLFCLLLHWTLKAAICSVMTTERISTWVLAWFQARWKRLIIDRFCNTFTFNYTFMSQVTQVFSTDLILIMFWLKFKKAW